MRKEGVEIKTYQVSNWGPCDDEQHNWGLPKWFCYAYRIEKNGVNATVSVRKAVVQMQMQEKQLL